MRVLMQETEDAVSAMVHACTFLGGSQGIEERSGSRHGKPAEIALGGRTIDYTFYDERIAALNVDREALLGSIEVKTLLDFMDLFAATAAREGVTLGIVYLPNKEEVIVPLASPDELSRTVEDIRGHEALVEGGILAPGALLTAGGIPDLQKNADAARDILREHAIELGLFYADPLDALRKHSAAGEQLFYTYDTHMNQAGYLRTAQALLPALIRWLE